MPHLKFHGKVIKQYHGIDKDTVVVASAGDVIHVSDAKAERLLKDFPTEFEIHHTKGPDALEPPEEPIDANTAPQEYDPDIETKEDKPARNKMVGKAKTKRRK
jgi:hypothetical protein